MTPNKMLTAFTFCFALALATLARGSTTDSDNTGKNVRDRETTAVTPEKQARGSSSDVAITRRIRQELVKEDDLSQDAKNIKIITNRGVVTLRGPVATRDEKKRIGSIANAVAGPSKVRNQTEVETQ